MELVDGVSFLAHVRAGAAAGAQTVDDLAGAPPCETPDLSAAAGPLVHPGRLRSALRERCPIPPGKRGRDPKDTEEKKGTGRSSKVHGDSLAGLDSAASNRRPGTSSHRHQSGANHARLNG